jgi:hypothetical protein
MAPAKAIYSATGIPLLRAFFPALYVGTRKRLRRWEEIEDE